MLSPIFTDLELASQISPSIGNAYSEAVEFSKVLPSHALVRFRDVLDGICHHQAKATGVQLDSMSIFEKINTLADKGAITFGLKDRCHKIRKFCNPGAHQDQNIDVSESQRIENFKKEGGFKYQVQHWVN